MQKFKGHYKQAVSLKKSGCTNNDVIFHAYAIWKEDEGNNFGLEQAWRLLKDQPKWFDQFTKNCSKRTNISTFGTYSSSSNLKTPVVDFEADTLSPIVHLMEQKTT